MLLFDQLFAVICRQQLKLDNMQATANVLVGGRLRLSCGRSRKVYVLLAVNMFLHGLRGFLTFHSFPQDSCGKIKQVYFCREHARNVRKVTETRGSSGGIFAVSSENRGLNRISVKRVLLIKTTRIITTFTRLSVTTDHTLGTQPDYADWGGHNFRAGWRNY